MHNKGAGTVTTSAMLVDWVQALSSGIRHQSFSSGNVEWVEPLPPHASERDIVFEEGTVFVCESDQEIQSVQETEPIIVVCQALSEAPLPTRRRNALIAETALSKQAFASSLQKRIRAIARWEHDLDRISAERGSYQEMLDISRDVLGNLITISDSTYRLLAYTPDMPTDDPITNELIEKGFHGERAVTRFRETKALSRWAKQGKTHYSGNKVTKNPSMNHVFKVNGAYFLQMVMTCNNVPYSQGLLDTFDILASHVKAHIRRCQSYESQAYAKGTEFLSALIAGKELPQDIVAQQARSIGLPENGTVRLYAIKPKAADMENLGYLTRRIGAALPDNPIVLQDGIAYLVARAQGADRAIEAPLSSLIDFSHVDVAVSGLLPTMQNLDKGARQTAVAFEYDSMARSCEHDGLDKCDPFARFEDYLFDHLLFSDKKDYAFLQFCLDTSVIARIRENRRNMRPSDDEVLRCYLTHECSANQTAEALGVHRNTVLNRIGAMTEREGLDLDSPKTRIGLISLFHLSDLLESGKGRLGPASTSV